jgi:hypothetical protein
MTVKIYHAADGLPAGALPKRSVLHLHLMLKKIEGDMTRWMKRSLTRSTQKVKGHSGKVWASDSSLLPITKNSPSSSDISQTSESL